jgi:hypothetical protein
MLLKESFRFSVLTAADLKFGILQDQIPASVLKRVLGHIAILHTFLSKNC